MNSEQLNELLLQALEHEMGGVKVYETALKCALNEDLQDEWQKYREQTRRHVEILQNIGRAMELNPDQETPGRAMVRHNGGGSGSGDAQGADGRKARGGAELSHASAWCWPKRRTMKLGIDRQVREQTEGTGSESVNGSARGSRR